MKIKKVALLATSAVLLAGGITTALAMNHKAATQSYQDQMDEVVVLDWGTNDVSAVTTLTSDAYQYRSVVVKNPSASKHSSGLSGKITIKFELVTDSTHELPGTEVALYGGKTVEYVKEQNMDGSHKKTTRGLDPDKTVTMAASQTMELAMTTSTDYMYVIEFDYDGTAVTAGKEYGGSLKITMDFVESK